MKQKFLKVSALTLVFIIGLSACQPDYLNEIEPDQNLIGQFFQSSYSTQPDPYDISRDIAYEALRVGSEFIGETIPGAGIVLPAFLITLFPQHSEEIDVWDEIKERVEKVVDEKIDDETYKIMRTKLIKIRFDIRSFLEASEELKASKWSQVDNDMNDYNAFTIDGQEVVLLPLFSQFVNLYLSFYRETVLQGENWHIGQAELDISERNLQRAIPVFSDYVDRWYQQGLNDVVANAPKPNSTNTEPFNTINRYVREMTLGVLDFRNMWAYFDPVLYPAGATIHLDREVYSDMIGYASSPFVFPAAPSQFPDHLKVWAQEGVNAIEVDYPNGGTNGRRDNQAIGSQTNLWEEFDLTDHPIIGASAHYSASPYYSDYKLIDAVKFYFDNGDETLESQVIGDGGKRADPGLINTTVYSYPDHILSSIYIPQYSYLSDLKANTLQSVIFGFKRKEDVNAVLLVLKSIYLGNPEPLNAEQLAELGNISVSQASGLIDEWHSEHESLWDK
ncbi:insecticidal delta-endotoxin Cry8Ea1 family protein [Xanthovirga aplysinae]|uniref:insecticidal delta-endotoxin Cry8Ea1 family protein n=1 Tax=Xanthovirga aplysinae TaxID=2529853 RepID=UPI0012BC109C|nr:insecticidal delta-endotoxin Cry8Ea1 family protein [Xanthovirga aplysinae]MTI33511.1 hypothetical protein [Xanthovirga aplysinae]